MNELSFSELCMARCIDLSRLGRGLVRTNPLVGAVIAENGKILGEGFHQRFGGAHAEINALQSIRKDQNLSQSSMAISLEPCCITGKTPPCTKAIIKAGIQVVQYGTADPNPKVSNRGVAELNQAGINTKKIQLEEIDAIISPFRIQQQHQRPYIILKFAQSKDGFIAKSHVRTKISNPLSDRLVHKWRSESDGILVGRNTVDIDNPQLTNRYYFGSSPVRIVIDPSLRSDQSSILYHDGGITWIINNMKNETTESVNYIQVKGPFRLTEVLQRLYMRDIGTLLVEGGLHTLEQFIQSGLWDEARIITSNQLIDQGVKAPTIQGFLSKQIQLRDDTIRQIFRIEE